MDKKDIVTETRNLETYWQQRNQQFLLDRGIINLTKPLAETGKLKWVLNEPKVLYDTCVAIMSAYQPRFRLPLTTNFTQEQKTKISKAERLLIGIFRSLDDRQLRTGRPYWLRELAYWIASGWWAVMAMVEKDPLTGETQFRADIFDPMTVYPEWDTDGLKQVARTYEVDKRTALSMAEGWKVPLATAEGLSTAKVINYWRRDGRDVFNAILLGDTEVKPYHKEPFDEIPILISPVGQPDKVSPDWQKNAGESVIASNRDTFEYTNQFVSLMATVIAATAYANLVTKTETGESPVKGEDVKGFGTIIPLKLGEDIATFKHLNIPPEVSFMMSLLSERRQQGGLPNVVFGSMPFEASGFAISQLMAAIRYKISPYLNTMQFAIAQVATNFLKQYKKSNYGKITLPTVNPREMRKGLFFVEEFAPEDVPDTIFVDVSIPITSALDKTQQIMFAKQAMSPPQLLSRETIWDEILEVQDSEQEYARIIQDQTLELPIVKQIGMLEQLRERVNLYTLQGKDGEANALKQYIMAVEMQLGMRQGVPVKPGETLSQTQGKPSPSQLPPEMSMSPSPDEINAMMGRPPPSPNRPISEEAQRLKSLGLTTA